MNPLLEALKVVNNQFGKNNALDLIDGLTDEALNKEENLEGVKQYLKYLLASPRLPLNLVDNCLSNKSKLDVDKEKVLKIVKKLPPNFTDFVQQPEFNKKRCVCSEQKGKCLYRQNVDVLKDRFRVLPEALSFTKSPCYAITSGELKVAKDEVLTQDKLPKQLLFNLKMVPTSEDVKTFTLWLKNKVGIIEIEKNKKGEFTLDDIFDFSFPLNTQLPLKLSPNEADEWTLKFDMIKFPPKEAQLPSLSVGSVRLKGALEGHKLHFNGKNLLLDTDIKHA